MVKYTQTIRRQRPMNCLSVIDHFVGLVLKGLRGIYPLWTLVTSTDIVEDVTFSTLPYCGTLKNKIGLQNEQILRKLFSHRLKLYNQNNHSNQQK